MRVPSYGLHKPLVVADMVRFQTIVGCRPGEVCAITPAMVDLLRGPDDHCFIPIEAEEQRRETKHAFRKPPLSCGNMPGFNASRPLSGLIENRLDTPTWVTGASSKFSPEATIIGENSRMFVRNRVTICTPASAVQVFKTEVATVGVASGAVLLSLQN